MAAIAHAFTQQTTSQTIFNKTSWFSVPGASIAAGSFVGSAKYLLIVQAQASSGDTAHLHQLHVVHGSTEFTGSHMLWESAHFDAASKHTYFYGTVFTQAATAEAVTLQAITTASQNIDVDTISLFAMRLDADLTENTDYWWTEDDDSASPVTHGGGTWTDFASITLTPSTSEDFLVIASNQVLINTAAQSFEYRLNRDSDTEVVPSYLEEGERTDEQKCYGLIRGYTLTAAEHTIKIQGQDDGGGGSNDHNWSGLFILRMDAMADHAMDWNVGEVDPGTGGAEIGALDFTPSTQADFLMLGFMAVDAAGVDQNAAMQFTVGGTVKPTGAFDSTAANSYDATDENPGLLLHMENLAASVQDLDFDAKEIDTAPVVEDRAFVAVSMELAAGGVSTSITAVIAAAPAAVLLPTITSVGIVSVSPPILTAPAAVLLPAIEIATTITAVIATAPAAVLLPTVTSVGVVSVTAVIATAPAAVLLPTVTSQVSTSITAIIATANAAVLLPTVTSVGVVSVTAVIATSNAAVLIPAVTAIEMVSTSITAVIAAAPAAVLLPTITAQVVTSVTAVIATAPTAVLLPTITSVRVVSVTAVVATATADVLLPVVVDQTADVAIDDSVWSSLDLYARDDNLGPVWVNDSTGYVFYLDTGPALVYRKTTTGIAGFGAPVTIDSNTVVRQWSIWFDKWTNGDSGTLIHIVWKGGASNDLLYRTLDTADDTLGTIRTIETTLTGGSANDSCSICKSRSGRLYAYWNDGTNEYFEYTTASGGWGTTWTARTAPGYAGTDSIMIRQGASADDNDMVAIYEDITNDNVRAENYDDSGNAWVNDSLVVTGDTFRHHETMSATHRHSDDHIILLASTFLAATTADNEIKCVDMTLAQTITTKTDVVSSTDDNGNPSVLIDQNNDRIWASYIGDQDGSEAWASAVQVYVKYSDDGGTTWSDQLQASVTLDDHFLVHLGMSTPGTGAGLLAPVWNNRDLDDLLGNIEIPIGGTDVSTTVTAVVAAATSAVLLPTVTSVGTVSVTAVIAAAPAAVLLPAVEIATTITAVVATANAAVLLPTVTSVGTVSVTAVVATATAAVLLPTVTTIGIVSVTAVIATAPAAALIPIVTAVTSGPVTVTAVIATATAAVLLPTIQTATIITAVPAAATTAVLLPALTSSQIVAVAAIPAVVTARVLIPIITFEVAYGYGVQPTGPAYDYATTAVPSEGVLTYGLPSSDAIYDYDEDKQQV
jgi:hypothetical protein